MLVPASSGATRPRLPVNNLGTFEGHRRQLEARRGEPVETKIQRIVAFAIMIAIIAFAVLA